MLTHSTLLLTQFMDSLANSGSENRNFLFFVLNNSTNQGFKSFMQGAVDSQIDNLETILSKEDSQNKHVASGMKSNLESIQWNDVQIEKIIMAGKIMSMGAKS